MPEITDLRAGDPAEVAKYRLTGRLGATVFTGRTETGEVVAVRMLPAEVDPELFLHAIEPLRAVTAAGTAQVLDTGMVGERAYVVSEFVDGPTLEAAGGALDEVASYRLAVGTITALVAIHQAGHVHGDIRPRNVLLGPDGPRLIDLGLERALAAAAVSTRKVEVPAYTAPERLRGAEAGPASDVFSWAATMAFAVSGASPFDGGSLGATVDRILKGPPTLPDLGELHALIASCLAKEPTARPEAGEVLLRLVGQTSFLTGKVVTGPPIPETVPPPRRRLWPPLAAAFVAGALVSGGGVYAVLDARTGTGVTVAARTTPTASPSPSPVLSASRTSPPFTKVAEKAATDTPLPAVGATLHEHPSDVLRLAAYMNVKHPFTSYARDKSGAFKTVATAEEPVVSPGGDWVALNPWLKFQNSEVDQIKFTRISTGETFSVPTVKKPKRTSTPVWSRDGGKLLLTVIDDDKNELSGGFVIVDLATRKATYVETEFVDVASLVYTFTPDGQVARGYSGKTSQGIDFYSTTGQVTKAMHWVGLPRNKDWFTPSGNRFATICPKGAGEVCVWDARTGARVATVPRDDDEGSVLGWYDDNHLLLQEPGKKGKAEVRIVDLGGATRRVLADVTPLRASMDFRRVPGK
ncbi:serine/threonine-protein kinase [Nonomuraea sp. NPDC050643]|uniref:serine/threonine protein kinase n=1 Tax=Nonomuraea sp. NPDC050643 TaxID=3155660 RepID=UPI0033F639CE